MRDARGRFAPMLLLGIAAVSVGTAIGYHLAMTGGLPVSNGVLVIVPLMFVALLVSFHHGQRASRTDRLPASFERSWDSFRRELDRSRRFGRPFVLVRIPAHDEDRPNGSSDGSLAMLPLMLRSIDHVWAMDGSMYLLLPESNGDVARDVLARLRSAMPDVLPEEGVEIALFPDDGLTTGALLANLRPAPVRGETMPVRLVPAPGDERIRRDELTG